MLVHHTLLFPLVSVIISLLFFEAHLSVALAETLTIIIITLTKTLSRHSITTSLLCVVLSGCSYYYHKQTPPPKTSLPFCIGEVLAKTDRGTGTWKECLTVRPLHPTHAKELMCFCARRTTTRPGDVLLLKHARITTGPSDLAPWLCKNNLDGFIFLKPNSWRILTHRAPPLLTRLKNRIYNASTSKLAPKTQELFSLVFFGREHRKDHATSLRHSCATWGISHYLARSGLHVTLLLLLWSFPLLAIRSVRIRFIVLLCILIVYALLSWGSASFIRALLVGLLGYSATCLHKPVQVGFLLSASCIILLIYSPFELFFLGFQLTYAFTLGTSLYFVSVTRPHLKK